MNIARVAVRTTVGSYFAAHGAHGAQKLLGWFDGDGLEGTAATHRPRVGLQRSTAL